MIRHYLLTSLITLTLYNVAWCNNTEQNALIPVNTPQLANLKNTENPSPDASKSNIPKITTPTVTVPPPPTLNVKAYVIMDATTGKVLAAFNSEQQLAPASLTKMMTSYVISMAIKEGKIHLTDPVRISEKSWRTGGSKMFVRIGTEVPVKDLMQGIIVDSGNDACVAMAEYVAGSEDSFADLMNQTGLALGMKNSHFVDSTGLPNPEHHSTAHDLAILGRALIYSFPEDYQWYSQKWFTYNGIRQPNRNRLLWRDPTVDGMKTGHTDEAGFCLVASAKRNNLRLITVIMGAPSDAARADDSQRLLDYGFRFFETHLIYPANTILSSTRVWNGAQKTVNAGILSPFIVSVVPGQFNLITYKINLIKELKAPVIKGQVLGELQAIINGKIVEKTQIVALKDDPIGNLWRRSYDKFAKYFS